MKKLLLILVLAILVSSGVFAQADVRPNWISGEVSLIGAGVRYERMLSPNLSLGANIYVNTLFIIWTDWGMSAAVRFYPWGGVFFVEGDVGFGYHSGSGDYTVTDKNGDRHTGSDWIGTKGIAITPAVGWKINPSKSGGFFVQPGIKLPIVIGKQRPIIDDWWYDKDDYKADVGVGIGFIMYCGFGFAF